MLKQFVGTLGAGRVDGVWYDGYVRSAFYLNVYVRRTGKLFTLYGDKALRLNEKLKRGAKCASQP